MRWSPERLLLRSVSAARGPSTLARRPVLDLELGHREVAGIPRGKAGSNPKCGGGDQAVGLAEGRPLCRELRAPEPGPFALDPSQRRDPQRAQQLPHGPHILRPCAAPDLLDVDRTYVGGRPLAAHPAQSLGGLAATQRIDQHGRVEQQLRHPQSPGLAGSPCVFASLRPDPGGRIDVPLVAAVLDGTERRLDLGPAALVLQGALDGPCDEGAAMPATGASVQLGDQVVVEADVQTHGPRLTHDRPALRRIPRAGPGPALLIALAALWLAPAPAGGVPAHSGGRRAFKARGLTLLGAIVAKLIYAAFLSIVLLGLSILAQVNGPAGSATGFLLSVAFTWSVFLKRGELVGWLTVGENERLASRGFERGQLAAMRIGGRVAALPTGALRAVARSALDLRRSRAVLGPGCSKLCWRHRDTEALGTASQRAIERDQPAAEKPRQRDVLSVIGATPSELSDAPCLPAKLRLLDSAHRRGFEPLVLGRRMLDADLAVHQAEVKGRPCLGSHQGRRNEILIAEGLEAFGAGDRRHHDGGVYYEGQRPRRDSCSSATQLGCGVPSSKVLQPSGTPTMSSCSSGSGTTTIRALGTCGAGSASTSRCSCSRVVMRPSLAAVCGLFAWLAFLALAVLAPPARGAPAQRGGSAAPVRVGAQRRGTSSKKAVSEEGGSSAQLTSPNQLGAGTLATELGASGQVDPLSGLGIRNPACDQLAQIRSRATRLSCEASGTPEGTYPASNYGFDIHIPTGISHLLGTILYGFATVLNGIWLGLLFVLRLVLSLLGLAFGLNPFGSGRAMSLISGALGRMYERISDPWLSTLIVCGGIWFAYKGLLKRELAAGVGGTLAAIAMLIFGLWVVHQPGESVGQLASLSDEVALGTISAPQSGSLARPLGSYAEAMSETWSRLVEVPFAGLDFSDVRWALGPPPAEAVQKANERFCDDFGALALLAVLAHLGSAQAKEACANFAAKRYGRPKRVIDLYLRSSPGSSAREALWSYFNASSAYKAKVAAQGGDGVLTRLSMLALFAIGLLGAILLLAWLAIRLFTQAAIAFILLLAAPFALFLPMLGDGGRRAFKAWGLTLLGAIVAKVIYAAFLSIVLLGISILGQVNGPAGSATGFLLSVAFTWSVFLKRGELVGWLTVGENERLANRGFERGQLAAMRIGGRVAAVPTGALRGVARRALDLRRSRAMLGAEATRRTAKSSLQDSARALADQRYREARDTVAAAEAAPASPKRGSKRAEGLNRTPRGGDARSVQGEGEGAAADGPTSERYRRAKELRARVERNQSRHGERWSDGDLRRFEAEDAELLKSSRDPADHAHRAGYERAQFDALRGPDREVAEAAIEKARKRDFQRLNLTSEVPGRIVGRGRQTAERMRQGVEELGGGTARREQLRHLRRERRSRDHLAPRRNLSRGA